MKTLKKLKRKKNLNKRYNIEEKIEIKKTKYEYYYKDKNIIEKLSIKYPTNKYEYYYKDLKTGRVIKKEGRGRKIKPELFDQELKKEEEQNKSGTKFNIKINF